MKCQKCGTNEANFHYTSNINGSVTEANLCSECAKVSGIEIGGSFGFGLKETNDRFNPSFTKTHREFPLRALLPGGGFIFPVIGHVPGFGFDGMLPGFTAHRVSPVTGECTCESEQYSDKDSCGCGNGQCDNKKAVVPEQNEKIDEEMKKRRELNLMREQMRAAADSDDFEQAMELRDKIREIEQQEGTS